MDLATCLFPRSAVTQPRIHKEVVEGRRYVRDNHVIGRHGDVQVEVRLRVHVLVTARLLSEGEIYQKKQSALCLKYFQSNI